MRASDLRSNGAANQFREGGVSRKKGSGGALLLGGLGLLLLVGVGAWLILPKASNEPPAAPGVPQATFGKNRVTLKDYDDAKWLSYYTDHSEILQEPIKGLYPYGTESSCVAFTNYIVCHSNDPGVVGTIWEFQPVLLGIKYLPPTIRSNDKAALDDVVVKFINGLERNGVDRFYWLGAVQGEAFCAKDDCYQVFQRQVLTWKRGSSQVSLSPLGEMAK